MVLRICAKVVKPQLLENAPLEPRRPDPIPVAPSQPSPGTYVPAPRSESKSPKRAGRETPSLRTPRPKQNTPQFQSLDHERSVPGPLDLPDIGHPRSNPKDDGNRPGNSNTDIVSLAVQYSTAHSKMQQAEMELARIEKLKKKGYVSAEEYENSQNEVELQSRLLETLKTVVEVLRQTQKTELDAVQIEFEQASQEKDQVRIAQLRAKLARVQGHLKILETIK